MRIKAFGSVVALSFVATLVVTGCGDDTTLRTKEPCDPAAPAECVGERSGRACPAADKEPGWVYFRCNDNEVCKDDGECQIDTDQAGLLGLCTEGEKQCVSSQLARQCAPGGNSWIPLACPIGTACNDGECVGGVEGGTEVCAPLATECATDLTTRTCTADGTEWLYARCPANEVCSEGACVFNTAAACTPFESQCVDAENGLRCKADGSGFEAFTCATDAPCDGSQCEGTACTPNETKCADPASLFIQGNFSGPQLFGSNQMYRCNAAGTEWDAVPCAEGEYCKWDSLTRDEAALYEEVFINWYNEVAMDGKGSPATPVFVHPSDRFQVASCQKPSCDEAMGDNGEVVCGDPEEPSSVKVDHYSQCQGLIPFRELEWVTFNCDAPDVCNPDSYYGGFYYGEVCNTECTPGESACDYSFGNDSDGVVFCNENGEWEDQAESCNTGVEEAKTCFERTAEDGYSREALCVDPVCAYVWNYYYDTDPVVGSCSGDELRTCDDSGTLASVADAVPCDTGSCVEFTQAGLRSVGSCQEACQEGEKRCVDGSYYLDEFYYGWGLSNSPFFEECVNGQWTGVAEACADAALCYQTVEFAPEGMLTSIICGGECVPGFRQCSVSDEQDPKAGVQTCGSDGHWSAQEDCETGACLNEHPGYSVDRAWDAECTLACSPGTFYCADYYGPATLCLENGEYEADAVDCGGNPCSSEVGCYECRGPVWARANGEVASTMCQGDSIIWCGDDNMWPATGTDCGAGKTCGLDPYSQRAICVDAPDAGPDASTDSGTDSGTSLPDSGPDAAGDAEIIIIGNF